jgi:ADP-heptose:LPS heptosyltransferase
MTAPPRRVLIVRTDRLGETLLTLPAIHALRQALPEAAIAACVQPALRELVARSSDLTEVLAAPVPTGRWWRDALALAGRWRAWRPDAVVVANPTKASHVAARLCGATQRIGYDHKWSGLLTRRVADRKALGEVHEVAYNRGLLSALGVPLPPADTVRLAVGPADEAVLVERLTGRASPPTHGAIAVHPWTSHPKKQWPMPRFRELIQRLRGRRPIVIVGGPDEQTRAAEAWPATDPAVTSAPDVTNLTGLLSLVDLAALLQRCALLISNDSGPVHVAAAVGTPTVVLFGTTDPAAGPRRWGPFGAGHTVIHRPSMDAIAVDEVAAAAERALPGSCA